MDQEGSVLGSAGKADSTTLSAIFTNIWTTYEKIGNVDFMMSEQEVNIVLFERLTVQEGRVVMTRVDSRLLLLAGDKTVELGMLKAKVSSRYLFS